MMETVLSDIQEFITGERPIDSFDRILATVLFLDIASSTERAAELGDTPWRNLLNSYYTIVRKELARFRGKETNTTGDSFLATFDGPARAVRCALAIALAVRQLGIEVRAGVHTGECELMGDNVGGIAVHNGARIMAKAKPGLCWSPGQWRTSCQAPEWIFGTTGPPAGGSPRRGEAIRRAFPTAIPDAACG